MHSQLVNDGSFDNWAAAHLGDDPARRPTRVASAPGRPTAVPAPARPTALPAAPARPTMVPVATEVVPAPAGAPDLPPALPAGRAGGSGRGVAALLAGLLALVGVGAVAWVLIDPLGHAARRPAGVAAQADLDKLRAELDAEKQRAKQEAAKLGADLLAEKQQAKQATAKLRADVEAEKQRAKQQAAKLRAELDKARAALKVPAAPVEDKSAALAEALEDVKRLRSEVDAARGRLDALRAQLDQERARRQKLEKALAARPAEKPMPPEKAPAVGGAQIAVVQIADELTAASPRDAVRKDSPCRVFTPTLTAGRTYLIDMMSDDVDPYLRLEDHTGKQLAADDDGGGFPNARLVFECRRTGTYRIVATTFRQEHGRYVLRVVEK